jgi:hypothetical protein
MIHWPIGYTWPIGFSLPPRSIHWEPGRIESREPGAYPLGNGADPLGAWVRLIRGEGVGPSAHGSRLRRHHRNRENFLENQKPNGYSTSTLHTPTVRDSITAL